MGAAKPERIGADRAASILGVKLRTVQGLAARGELPSAAKIGKLWTFNETSLRAHVAAQEAMVQERAARVRREHDNCRQSAGLKERYKKAMAEMLSAGRASRGGPLTPDPSSPVASRQPRRRSPG